MILISLQFIIKYMIYRQGREWVIDDKTNIRQAIDNNLKEAYENRKNLVFHNYIVEQREGQGTYGSVYRIRSKDQPAKKYALKVIDLQRCQGVEGKERRQRIVQLSKHEEESLKKMDSIFIIKLIEERFQNQYCIVFVLEYCNGGNMFKYLSQKDYCLDEEEAISIIKQVCLGVFQFYQKNIIHRDMKLENIMRTDGFCKIIDLGFCKQISYKNEEIYHTPLGTLYTMAPQIMKGHPYGVKADIYSIGIILLKMVIKNFTFAERNPQILLKQCLNKQNCPLRESLMDFLIKSTRDDPSQRIGWDQLLDHPVFSHHKHITQSNVYEEVSFMWNRMKSCSAVDIQSLIEQNDKVLMSQIEVFEKGKTFIKTQDKKRERNFIQSIRQEQSCQITRIAKQNEKTKTQKRLLVAINRPQGQIFGSEQGLPQTHRGYLTEESQKIERAQIKIARSMSQHVKIDNHEKKDFPIYKLRISEDLDSFKFIQYTSQIQEKTSEMGLLLKKALYIIDKLIKPLENPKNRILDPTSETHIRLINLLCQRASIDLQKINSFTTKYSDNDRKRQRIKDKMLKVSGRHMKYSQLLDSPFKSKVKNLLVSISELFSGQSRSKTILSEGEEGKDFSRQQQIQYIIKYINKIKNDIYMQSLKKHLLAFQKVMALDCREEQFQDIVESIIKKC